MHAVEVDVAAVHTRVAVVAVAAVLVAHIVAASVAAVAKIEDLCGNKKKKWANHLPASPSIAAVGEYIVVGPLLDAGVVDLSKIKEQKLPNLQFELDTCSHCSIDPSQDLKCSLLVAGKCGAHFLL